MMTFMTSNRISVREDYLLYFAGYFLIATVGIASLIQPTSWLDRTVIVIGLLLFAVVHTQGIKDFQQGLQWRAHVGLAIGTGLVLGLIFFSSAKCVLLFFILSVHAMISLPVRHGVKWLVSFSLITTAIFVFEQGWIVGVIEGLVHSSAFVFFGIFGSALVRAELARNETEQLFGELQVAHKQLYDYASQVETLAVAEERNRLSRDLHDTLGHRLTVSIVQLEGAARLVDQDAERAGEMVDTVRGQLREGLDEVRQTVAMLRTPLATDLSLPKALKKLTLEFREATSLEIHTTVPDTLPPLPDGHRMALYRVAQEGLTNVQRHAQADNAWLQLEVEPEAVTLKIKDDGAGIASDREKSAGFGLKGMQERAAQLGGALDIISEATQGTQLVFRIPRTLEMGHGSVGGH